MKHGVDDCLVECFALEKRHILPLHDPVSLIGLDEIQHVAVSKKFIKGVKKAVVAEFADGEQAQRLRLPIENGNPQWDV